MSLGSKSLFLSNPNLRIWEWMLLPCWYDLVSMQDWRRRTSSVEGIEEGFFRASGVLVLRGLIEWEGSEG